MTAATDNLLQMMELLQMTDSMFPVGTFSFSNGLETASFEHFVHDAETLRQYTEAVSRQGAFTDGIAALHAFRAAKDADIDRLKSIDNRLMMCKLNDEARLMLIRMGKKLSELAVKLLPDDKFASEWLMEVEQGRTEGSYPVMQGIIFALRGLSEEALFASHQFGVINMVVSAALRCVRVSHYDTQHIINDAMERVPAMYEKARELTMDDLNCFVPQMDIFASLHEKGMMRMFMN